MRTVSRIVLLIVILGLAGSWSPSAVADTEPWRFAVLCDTRGDNVSTLRKTCINDAVVEAIAADIVGMGCEAVLVPGDLVNGWFDNGGTDYAEQFRNWRMAMRPVYDVGIAVYPVRGNHENCSETIPSYPPPDPKLLEAYLATFQWDVPRNGPVREESLTYFVKHKNALFVGLDQYITLHRVNQPWLERVLNAHAGTEAGSPYVFVYGHEPAYRVCHADCLATYEPERDAFWSLLKDRGVLAYFCGHDHLTYAQSPSAITPPYQIVVGGGGAPFVPDSELPPVQTPSCVLAPELGDHYVNNKAYAYVVVTVADNRVDAMLRQWSGPTIDTWTELPLFTYPQTL
jgi:hypothetical protein